MKVVKSCIAAMAIALIFPLQNVDGQREGHVRLSSTKVIVTADDLLPSESLPEVASSNMPTGMPSNFPTDMPTGLQTSDPSTINFDSSLNPGLPYVPPPPTPPQCPRCNECPPQMCPPPPPPPTCCQPTPPPPPRPQQCYFAPQEYHPRHACNSAQYQCNPEYPPQYSYYN